MQAHAPLTQNARRCTGFADCQGVPRVQPGGRLLCYSCIQTMIQWWSNPAAPGLTVTVKEACEVRLCPSLLARRAASVDNRALQLSPVKGYSPACQTRSCLPPLLTGIAVRVAEQSDKGRSASTQRTAAASKSTI